MEPAAAVIFVAAYVLGSVDFGVIVPRLAGADIYAMGSGNPGATNVLRTMGRKMAAFVVVGDIAKGLVAAMVGDLVVGEAAGFAAGFAAVVGHCFPVWHRFRGGKGVATAIGATLWLEPWLGLVVMVGWGAAVALTKRASVASIVFALGITPAMAVLGHREWSLVWIGAAAALVLVRHHANIGRLLRGEEHTIEGAP